MSNLGPFHIFNALSRTRKSTEFVQIKERVICMLYGASRPIKCIELANIEEGKVCFVRLSF